MKILKLIKTFILLLKDAQETSRCYQERDLKKY